MRRYPLLWSIVAAASAQALADRIDNLSTVAVVVSNYEKLAPFEASYGLENNITNDLYTSFIPRFVWNEKPPTSEPSTPVIVKINSVSGKSPNNRRAHNSKGRRRNQLSPSAHSINRCGVAEPRRTIRLRN